MQVQYHQLCECRVQPEGEPDTGEVYPKPCRSQRNGGNAVGILAKGKKEGGGGSDQFFQTSAVNFLAACIYFFVNYEREPYDKDGNKLYAEKVQDKGNQVLEAYGSGT